MEDLVNKAVLFDYFSGRVSPLQKKSVESWLSEGSNRELYYQWLHEWEMNRLQTNTNWQLVYEKTAQRINNTFPAVEEQEPPPKTWTISRWGGWISRSGLLAASVALLLMAIGWLFRDALLYKTVRTGFGETRSLTLPDGSAVTMNANSSLRYSRWFGTSIGVGNRTLIADSAHENPRMVELTGEADFSIRHLPNNRRFVVMTPGGLKVTVLGTQFTVFSRERATRVALRSGRVQLTTGQKTTPPLIMQPGDLVTLNRQGKLDLTRTAHPESMAAWKDHRFNFDQTSLREIADILHENYGLVVTIGTSQLAGRTISGSFTAQNANELLKLIAQLLQVNYIRENDRVSFTD
ncbi:FecR family protein [Spirosoma fluviale]|uniref:FecR family protein n=1 Tax=Spirosoma fluviale TaxID=1597977 RepID=A0A286GV01_9BACT|nr:FecR domain-containing protein [Spirosoma fluviale]SOD99321.1 FecR family protein [Spirosoma fluviale]